MEGKTKYKFAATFFFVAFWIMFAIATGAISQRDKARELRADVDGKKLICRLEEQH